MTDLEIPERTRVFTASREYDAHIIKLFHATGDFSHRRRWQEGVKAVEVFDEHLPRVGMKCRCVTERGDEIVYASSLSFTPERIEFSETDEGKNASLYFTLEALGSDRTRVTVDLYLRTGWFRELAFKLLEGRKLEAALEASLVNLEGFLPELDVSAEY